MDYIIIYLEQSEYKYKYKTSFKLQMTTSLKGSIKLKVEAWEGDSDTANDFIDRIITQLSSEPAQSQSTSSWKNEQLFGSRSQAPKTE